MAKPTPGAIRFESDMYAHVKTFLQSLGWDVKAEVEGCDAAAMKDGKLLAAEMKLTLNLDVILQAVERQRMADIVYIAVPRKPAAIRTKRWRDILELLKRLNIGLLVVSATDVEELIEPTLSGGSTARGRAVRIRIRTISEMHRRSGDWNTGGVRGQTLVTAYREAALRLASLLAENGPMSAKLMKPEGEKSKTTYNILTANHYGWFKPLGHGLFDVTKDGHAALVTYAEVLGSGVPKENEDEVFAGTVEN